MAMMPAIFHKCEDGPLVGMELQYVGTRERCVTLPQGEFEFGYPKPHLIKPNVVRYELQELGSRKIRWVFQGWVM